MILFSLALLWRSSWVVLLRKSTILISISLISSLLLFVLSTLCLMLRILFVYHDCFIHRNSPTPLISSFVVKRLFLVLSVFTILNFLLNVLRLMVFLQNLSRVISSLSVMVLSLMLVVVWAWSVLLCSSWVFPIFVTSLSSLEILRDALLNHSGYCCLFHKEVTIAVIEMLYL